MNTWLSRADRAAAALRLQTSEVVPAFTSRRRLRSPYFLLGLFLLAPVTIAALAPGLVAPHDPYANIGPALTPPGLDYLFGTDDLGRDLLSEAIWGARTSLLIGAASAVVSICVGLLVGVAAGYVGSWVDDTLMRATEIVMVLPRFFVALLVVTFFGASLFNVCLVLGLTGWPSLARIARAETLLQRSREHVLASVALGASPLRIMFRHILPGVQPVILSVAAPIMTGAILTEAALAYLGLADPNWVSWGKIIQNGQTFYNQGWWISAFPGLAIVASCVGLTLVIEGVEQPPTP
jgi:peptide/nickel transport system permease protein